MKINFLPSTILICVTISFICCNGQVKKDLSIQSVSAPKEITNGQSKMSRTFLQDRAGIFWLCNGKNEGVIVYDGKKFTHYTEKDGLSSNFVWTILEDNSGKLWFGTADGITCYDGKKFTIIPITAIKGNTNYHKTKADPTYDFPNSQENWVNCILQDKTGVFWFGTSTGIYRYDGKAYSHFSVDDGIINNSGVVINSGHAFGVESILQDKSGNVWFGGRGTEGVFRYDGISLTNFKVDSTNWVRPLLQDKSDDIWFSTRLHTKMYRFDGKIFSGFAKNEIPDWVFSMEEDNKGNLWFNNGKNGGVTFYDGKSFTNFTAKDGLGENFNFASSILKDKDGNIWFGTRNVGLYKYNGKNFTSFSE